MNNIILFGIQGSGKGTQASILAKHWNLTIFETGAELRKIMKEESDLGKTVRDIIQRGDLVHNAIVMDIIENFLKNTDTKTQILFDGIPRSMEQKETFDTMLQKHNRDIQGICLEVPRDEVILRMKSRGRADDTDAVIKRRIANYESETVPVIQEYEREEKMIRVNGFQEIKDVTAEILEKVQ